MNVKTEVGTYRVLMIGGEWAHIGTSWHADCRIFNITVGLLGMALGLTMNFGLFHKSDEKGK